MRNLLVLVCCIYAFDVNRLGLAQNKTRHEENGNHIHAYEIVKRQLYAIKMEPGVIIERWEGIDGYLISKLLEDPRFPDLPTHVFHSPVFQQPRNWGDNYGSRTSGFFVPQQTGNHVFYIASDSEGQLFLSITDNPDQKILICRVQKGHESQYLQFTNYPEQQSDPIPLRKGSYYYLEALHKDQYGNDHMEAAVKTPDNKTYAPIPSQFLWTLAPSKVQVHKTAGHLLLVKIAAKAGAKAGASLGIAEAHKSGATAGAIAGYSAGAKAGAEAGAKAATNAATAVATKTLKDALAKLGLPKPVFNIYTANGTIISYRPGAPSQFGVKPGATGTISGNIFGQAGSQAWGNATTETQVGVSAIFSHKLNASATGVFQGAFAYNAAKPYYIFPNTSAGVHIIATHKQFIDPHGFARVLVHSGLYVIHSLDAPAVQDPNKNLCWRITNEKLELARSCQVFAAHIPGFMKGDTEFQTISFESACSPGRYIRQKNYRFALGRKGDQNFKKDASASFHQVFSLPGTFQFSLLRKGWYICRSVNKNYHRIQIVTDFHMASVEWLKRCSFALRPISASEDPLMNCLNLLHTPKTPVTHAKPSKPATRPTTGTTSHKPEGPCLRFRFYNNAGVPFMLYSSLKSEGYLVTGPRLDLHYIIKNSQVTGLEKIQPNKKSQVTPLRERRRIMLSTVQLGSSTLGGSSRPVEVVYPDRPNSLL